MCIRDSPLSIPLILEVTNSAMCSYNCAHCVQRWYGINNVLVNYAIRDSFVISSKWFWVHLQTPYHTSQPGLMEIQDTITDFAGFFICFARQMHGCRTETKTCHYILIHAKSLLPFQFKPEQGFIMGCQSLATQPCSSFEVITSLDHAQ